MIVFYVVRVNEFQDRSLGIIFTCLSIALSSAFGFFCIVFFTIKYKRTKMYVKLFDDIETGIIDEEVGVLSGYDDTIRDKDFVSYYAMKITVPSRNMRASNVDREVLVYAQAPHPVEEVGAKIKVLTHSNVLIAFEVIQPTQE